MTPHSIPEVAVGIDPLILCLEKRLKGITIYSTPVLGPVLKGAPSLSPMEEKYTVVGYADDLKPSITSLEEFNMVDKAPSLFEKSSGCKLHRDPASGKCKFLALGDWRVSMTQDMIPINYMILSDKLEMVGVDLYSTYQVTKRVNGEQLVSRIQNTIGPWRGGNFMHLSQRSHSVNSYALSKIWFKTNCLDLRVTDIKNINSKVKSWLYSDMFEKPEQLVLHRPVHLGGLNLHNVQ